MINIESITKASYQNMSLINMKQNSNTSICQTTHGDENIANGQPIKNQQIALHASQ